MADPLSPVNFVTLLDSESSRIEALVFEAIRKSDQRNRLFQFGGDRSLSKGRKRLLGTTAPLDMVAFRKNYVCTTVDSGFICLQHSEDAKNFRSQITLHEFALVDIQAGTRAIPIGIAAAAAKLTVGLGLRAVSLGLGGGSGLIPVARGALGASTKLSLPHVSPSDLHRATKAEAKAYRYLSKIPGLRGLARRKQQAAEGMAATLSPQVQALEGVLLLVNVVTPGFLGASNDITLGEAGGERVSIDWAPVHPGSESLLRIGRADRNISRRIVALLQSSGSNTPSSGHLGYSNLFDDSHLFCQGLDSARCFPVQRRAISTHDSSVTRVISSNDEIRAFPPARQFTLGALDKDDFYSRIVGGAGYRRAS